MGYSRSLVFFLANSRLIGPRLAEPTFCLLKKSGVIRARPTRRSRRGGLKEKNQSETRKFLSVGLINAGRLSALKIPRITDHISFLDLDILTITETWLDADHGDGKLCRLCPPGYSFLHRIRCDGRMGGGVAVIFRDSIRASLAPTIETDVFTSFEYIATSLFVNNVSILLVTLYRPPGTVSVGAFLCDLSSLLERISTSKAKLLLVGDFNFHIDDPFSADANKFLALIDAFGLVQFVNGPTHSHGHTLDLVFSRASDNLVLNCEVGEKISDHFAVYSLIRAHRPRRPAKTVRYRAIKSIDVELFATDLKSLPLFTNPAESLDDLVEQYNSGLAALLDKHAPITTKTFTVRPDNSWHTPEIDVARRKARSVEKKWRRRRKAFESETELDTRNWLSRLIDMDSKLLRINRDHLTRLIHDAKVTHLRGEISTCGSDQKALFRVVDKHLFPKQDRKLPQHDSPQQLADEFSNYFQEKITNLRASLESSQQESPFSHDDVYNEESNIFGSNCLFDFMPVSSEDIISIVKRCPTKSCDLDPIPTCLLKKVIHVLALPIRNIINLSLASGVFPSCFKLGLVSPLLKKPNLCPEQKTTTVL